MQSNIPCVQLIDFGVSIDLKLFPKGTTFKKVTTPTKPKRESSA